MKQSDISKSVLQKNDPVFSVQQCGLFLFVRFSVGLVFSVLFCFALLLLNFKTSKRDLYGELVFIFFC